MERRRFLCGSVLGSGSAIASCHLLSCFSERTTELIAPVWGFDPVVGDGTWIWREPPKNERGYLEPRSYEVSIGIELTGVDSRCEAIATTPVPLSHPEQTIDEMRIETSGCDAIVRELDPGAAQLLVHAPMIAAGQVVTAMVHYKMTLYKQYLAFEKDQFPEFQKVPKEIQLSGLGDSPGIQTNASVVKKLAASISQSHSHPWDKAQSYVNWIQESIRPQLGAYTSVLTAIQRKTGDCEEMSALFVAFCRASGIPARLVWVPNHNWAEFYLTDHEQKGRWIPVHPACYRWFGWTGAHELVIQKGDRIRIPEQNNPSRLMMDWIRSDGRPSANYIASMKPIASSGSEDPGPGARIKDTRSGEWELTLTHQLDRYARR